MGFGRNFLATQLQARNRTGVPRPPLRTFSEMAEEFGITWRQLCGHMNSSSHPAPKPIWTVRNNGVGTQVSYYNPHEMRAWWKLHNAKGE